MFRQMFLIKEDQPHAKHFEIGPENPFSQIFRVFPCEKEKTHAYSFSFFIIHFKCFLKVESSYSSLTLGTSTIVHVPFISLSSARKASRSSRLIRLRCTLLPCLFPTEMPMRVCGEGIQIIVREGENARLPFEKSF